MANDTCYVPGNSDLYGLGIRTGIYLQWVSSLIANNCYPEEVPTLLVTNTIFLIAVCIATLKLTADSSLKQAEYLVLLRVLYGFLLTVLTVNGTRVRRREEESTFVNRKDELGSIASRNLRRALTVGIICFSIWYWASEANVGARDSACRTYGFLFTKIPLSSEFYRNVELTFSALLLIHHIIQFLIGIAILAGLAIIAMIRVRRQGRFAWSVLLNWRLWAAFNDDQTNAVVALLCKALPNLFGRAFRQISRKKGMAKEPKEGHIKPNFFEKRGYPEIGNALAESLMLRAAMVFLYLPLRKSKIWPRLERNRASLTFLKACGKSVHRTFQFLKNLYPQALNILYLVWAVVGIELTLIWNNVSDVYTIQSTGQLIPFLTGILSMAEAIWGLWLNYLKQRRSYLRFRDHWHNPKHIPLKKDEAWWNYPAVKRGLKLKADPFYENASRSARHSISAIDQLPKVPRYVPRSEEEVEQAKRSKAIRAYKPWYIDATDVLVEDANGGTHKFLDRQIEVEYPLGGGRYEIRKYGRWSCNQSLVDESTDLAKREDAEDPLVPTGYWEYPTPKGNIARFWDQRYGHRSRSCPELWFIDDSESVEGGGFSRHSSASNLRWLAEHGRLRSAASFHPTPVAARLVVAGVDLTEPFHRLQPASPPGLHKVYSVSSWHSSRSGSRRGRSRRRNKHDWFASLSTLDSESSMSDAEVMPRRYEIWDPEAQY
ncbi:hypothetical protein PV05_02244 [Exophiala xenobiotica]|uniref:Uncharacterized protein n=1 Tax=Exophiala xenobiotica TaxID=348802 RepID=A0A0D2EPZ4_9EURO|nr:uncharacterized protein PV05_02244 [Exophiala xenobiotica]KIW57678.1 hypothetical protein PV05_02244 [Exophiala xenobiotica]